MFHCVHTSTVPDVKYIHWTKKIERKCTHLIITFPIKARIIPTQLVVVNASLLESSQALVSLFQMQVVTLQEIYDSDAQDPLQKTSNIRKL